MAITNGYITLNLLKSSLSIEDNIDDEFLELAIESGSRQIDQACERQFFQASDTRVYAPRDSFVTEIDDLVTLTTLKTSSDADGVFDVEWEPKDYQLEPLNGIVGGIPSPTTQIRVTDEYLFVTDGGEATVEVTGTFGWPEIPVQIQQATLILASRLFERRNSPLGVAGFGDLGAVRVSKIDADIDNLIGPFKKVRMA
jgi:hypothetical protein